MLIVWDEPKRLSNLDKYGFDFRDVDEAFFFRSAIIPARSRRRKAVGPFAGGTIVVIFSHLGTEALSIISMRNAKAYERKLLG